MSLAQLIETMHNIYQVQVQTSVITKNI